MTYAGVPVRERRPVHEGIKSGGHLAHREGGGGNTAGLILITVPNYSAIRTNYPYIASPSPVSMQTVCSAGLTSPETQDLGDGCVVLSRSLPVGPVSFLVTVVCCLL